MGQRGHGRRRLGWARSSRRCGAGEEPGPPAPSPRPPPRRAPAAGPRCGACRWRQSRQRPARGERHTARHSRSEAGPARCNLYPMLRWASASSRPHHERLNCVSLHQCGFVFLSAPTLKFRNASERDVDAASKKLSRSQSYQNQYRICSHQEHCATC